MTGWLIDRHQSNQSCVSSFGKALKMPDFVCQGKVLHSEYGAVKSTSMTEVQDTGNRSALGRRKTNCKTSWSCC